MSNRPKIRFNGYQSEWQTEKFSSVFTPLKNNTLSRAELNDEEGKAKNIHYGDILIKFGEYLDAEKEHIPFITSDELAEKLSSFALQNGDVIIADTAEDSTVGKCTEIGNISEDMPVVSGLHTIPVRPNSDFASGYLGHFMNSDAYHNQLLPLIQGTKVSSIAKTYLGETDIRFPTDVSEQEQISIFLCYLNDLIAAQQQKCEKLIVLKEACLEKMFPRNGFKVPEIRFHGFTEDWKQHALDDVVNVYDGVHQTPDYQKSGVMFLSVENIATLTSEKYISEDAFKRDFKVYPERGDVLMTRIGDVGTPNVVESSEKLAYYVSLALLKPRNVDSYFLCYAIQSPFFQKGLKDRTLVTAIPQKINKDEIGKVEILLPSEMKEQQFLGEFFRKMNDLIIVQQSKLEKLKQLKQSMFHSMFV